MNEKAELPVCGRGPRRIGELTWRPRAPRAKAAEHGPRPRLRRVRPPGFEEERPADAEPVFNLDVEGTRTFFVGEHDALVHDNTPPDPKQKPFDVDVP